MLQNNRGKLLIALTVVLLLITSAFYTTTTAQQVNTNDPIKALNLWKVKSLKDGHWVHLVYSVTSNEDNGVILPNGQPMPSSYVADDWYYLNETGLVEKGVFTIKDTNGSILQQSAFQNNIMINFTFDDRQEDVLPYPLNIDLGFGTHLKGAKEKGLAIKKFDENVKDRASFAYSFVEELKLPTQLGGQSVIVDGIIVKGNFDKETRDLLQTQTIFVLNDGTEMVYETAEILSVDSFPTANDEVLSILEMVK